MNSATIDILKVLGSLITLYILIIAGTHLIDKFDEKRNK